MLNFKQYCCSSIFKIYLLLIFLCGSIFANAQPDSLATKSYEELHQNFFKTINKNPEKSLIYLNVAYKIAKKENDTIKIIDVLSKKAYSKSLVTKNEEALQDIEEATVLAKSTKNYSLLSRLYSQKGNIATIMGEHIKALEAQIKSKDYAVLSGNKSNELKALINIAFIKQLNQAYDEAIAIYKESLNILDELNISTAEKNYDKISLYSKLCDAYLRKQELNNENEDDLASAEYYNNLGLEICSKKENTIDYYLLLMNKAIIYFEKEEHSESIQLTNEIIAHAEKQNDDVLLSTAYFYMGKNYDALENHSKAIMYLEKFYEILKKSEKVFSNERQLHALLALNYSKIGNGKKSKFHYKAQERLLQKERKEHVEVVSTIHTKHDIEEINDKLEVLSAEFEAEEKRKKLLYIISALLLMLLIGSFIFYRTKVKRIQKRAEAVLQKVIQLETQQEKQKEENQKTGTSISEKVTDKKAAILLEKLAQFEAKEEYLSIHCSLSYVAEKVKSNTSYVSNVINNYKNKTFKSYITELRINAALIRLKNDEKLRSYTIQAIAEEFGFKRQETFSKAFKSQTGIYPSQYLKKLREDLEID
ncbi:AraC family transcriptional regulator [Kordia algicida OT-1]|uniref:Tetratricopeptide TPR_2 n=1 Tax=Kordia algicida OT-1 TaxID=391587 RepID=A9DVU2_9FLAO|nr:AraC family transcriptional regulator [Kordia algicida]EDP96467.1 Tetratricopeptide TPR_2 [Kordia algicida OT-1]